MAEDFSQKKFFKSIYSVKSITQRLECLECTLCTVVYRKYGTFMFLLKF